MALYCPFSYLAKTERVLPTFALIILSLDIIRELQVEPLRLQSIFDSSIKDLFADRIASKFLFQIFSLFFWKNIINIFTY